MANGPMLYPRASLPHLAKWVQSLNAVLFPKIFIIEFIYFPLFTRFYTSPICMFKSFVKMFIHPFASSSAVLENLLIFIIFEILQCFPYSHFNRYYQETCINYQYTKQLHYLISQCKQIKTIMLDLFAYLITFRKTLINISGSIILTVCY